MKRRHRIPGFVPTFGRCPTCERPFPSRYALKRHVELQSCSTADRAPAKPGATIKGGA